MELTYFRIDASWTKTNLAFLLAWTTRSLALDAVLEQPITESQKHIWFTRAVSPKAILSLAISQFDTSERLTSIGFGSSYVKANFSILYEHVIKDVATRANQTEHIAQGKSSRRVHETQISASSAISVNKSGNKEKSTFIGQDGERHSYAIPPEKWKIMSPTERLAALAKIRADRGLPPKPIWHPNPSTERKRLNVAAAPVESSPGNTTISYAEVVNPTPSIVSGMTQHSAAPPMAPPPAPPASSYNTLHQVLSSTQTPAPVSTANPSTTEDLLSIDGCFYRRINSTSISYNLSNHASTPVLSSLIDGGANGGMAGNDIHTLFESTFSKANVTGIGESLIQDLQGRHNLLKFKYLMSKIEDEATRLGKDVSEGNRANYKSIFFACKGATGTPHTTKQGRSRRIETITWSTAIKIVGFKTGG
jgi:hypothetical protein